MDNSTANNISTEGTTVDQNEVTISPTDQKEHYDEDLSYLLLSLFSVVILVVLTVIVIMLLQRKRKIDRLRHRLMPFYNFAPGEEEDWETELLESEGEGQTRRDYNSVSLPYYQQHQM